MLNHSACWNKLLNLAFRWLRRVGSADPGFFVPSRPSRGS
jgi:hypothetical protein